jgi:hypothetical protein
LSLPNHSDVFLELNGLCLLAGFCCSFFAVPPPLGWLTDHNGSPVSKSAIFQDGNTVLLYYGLARR